MVLDQQFGNTCQTLGGRARKKNNVPCHTSSVVMLKRLVEICENQFSLAGRLKRQDKLRADMLPPNNFDLI